jgi:hypothetical protein
MIISHKHRFIFLKTSKTAGTSIEIALSQHCGPDDVITPISVEDEATRQELGFRGPQNDVIPLRRYRPRDWAKFIKFRQRLRFHNHAPASDVRRWVGAKVWNDYFVFCFERNPYDKAISRYYWSTRGLDGVVEINTFLRSFSRKKISNWHIYSINDKLVVDFVGRYERLGQDLRYVWKKVGLPSEPTLPRAKGGYRTDRRHYSELLDEEGHALIDEICGREIAEFGYKYEETQAVG